MPVTWSSTNTAAAPRLPMEQRYTPIRYESEPRNQGYVAMGDGGCLPAPSSSTGTIAYPINYDELYNLKGRLLTLVDATFTDREQRKAHKDMVWQTLRAWMDDIENGRFGTTSGIGTAD